MSTRPLSHTHGLSVFMSLSYTRALCLHVSLIHSGSLSRCLSYTRALCLPVSPSLCRSIALSLVSLTLNLSLCPCLSLSVSVCLSLALHVGPLHSLCHTRALSIYCGVPVRLCACVSVCLSISLFSFYLSLSVCVPFPPSRPLPRSTCVSQVRAPAHQTVAVPRWVRLSVDRLLDVRAQRLRHRYLLRRRQDNPY